MHRLNSLPFRSLLLFMALLLNSVTLIFTIYFSRNDRYAIVYLLVHILIFVLTTICGYFFVYRQYIITSRRIGQFASRHSISDLTVPEIMINQETQMVLERLKESEKLSSTLELTTRQAQYVALQNQINPHFLYNTLESIRSEALTAGLMSVAEMCEALATFFRYTISNTETLVTIDEELQNTQIYFYIQKYRFGSRLDLTIDYDADDRQLIQKCKIPKLTLQPIVENAIIHGIEQMIGDGIIKIRMQLTKSRLIITVSDDGVGMPEDKLNQINENMVKCKIVNNARNGGKGIALTNVNNRIKSLFGEDYGVVIYSTLGVGTDVEITLPITKLQEFK